MIRGADLDVEAWLSTVSYSRWPSGEKRYAWMAAQALRPWLIDGAAEVALGVLQTDTGLDDGTLRRGFTALEAAGLLTRDPQRRKPGTFEFLPRIYRPQIPHG